MDITVKVNPARGKKAASLVRKRLKEAHPELAQGAAVEEVFPGLAAGRRAGMVTVKLPKGASAGDAQAVLRTLEEDDAIEYACHAHEKKSRHGKPQKATARSATEKPRQHRKAF